MQRRIRIVRLFPELSTRDFRGFPSLQEVECWGGYLQPEVKLLSLAIFPSDSGTVLAYANPYTNECITFTDYSSCYIDTSDTKQSRLRVLVSDLTEGHSRRYGCNITTFKSVGHTKTSTMYIAVERKSKLYVVIMRWRWLCKTCMSSPVVGMQAFLFIISAYPVIHFMPFHLFAGGISII